MKKIISILVLLLILIFSISTFVLANSTIKFGYLNGLTKWDDGTSTPVVGNDSGMVVSYEYAFPRIAAFEFGLGVSCQMATIEVTNFNSQLGIENRGRLNFVPVYATMNYYFVNGSVQPYFTGKFGYNVIHSGTYIYNKNLSTSGGQYDAYGIGVELDKKTIYELLVTENKGKYDTLNVNSSNVSFEFGFKF